jgi:hypothetical protein
MARKGITYAGTGESGNTYSMCILGIRGNVGVDDLHGLELEESLRGFRFPALSFVKVRSGSPILHTYVESFHQTLSPNSKRRNPESDKYFQGASFVILPGEVLQGGQPGVSVDYFPRSFKTRGGDFLPSSLAFYVPVLRDFVTKLPRDASVDQLNEVTAVQKLREFLGNPSNIFRESPSHVERQGIVFFGADRAHGVYQKRVEDLSMALGEDLVRDNLRFA